MLVAFKFLNILSIAYALGIENTAFVPPSCPGGRQWYNGACRKLLEIATSPKSQRKISDIFSNNLLRASTDCPSGQEDINGKCRDVWQRDNIVQYPHALKVGNTVSGPPQCSGGQQWSDGRCRDSFLRTAKSPESQKKISDIFAPKSIHTRSKCVKDINGQCRDIWRSGDLSHLQRPLVKYRYPHALKIGNTVTVRPNRPGEQRRDNGGCHDPLLSATASSESQRKISGISSANLMHVHQNCPGGQQYINGQCHYVWRSADLATNPPALRFDNTATVPPKCTHGKQWYMGACRDPFLRASTSPESQNLVPVSPKCPGGQQYINGQCHEVMLSDGIQYSRYPYSVGFVNTQKAPPHCPGGQVWNNGACRNPLLRGATSQESQSGQQWNNGGCYDPSLNATSPESQPPISSIYFRNVISVPPNCPAGYVYTNGQCREVFRTNDFMDSLIYQQLIKLLDDYVKKIRRA